LLLSGSGTKGHRRLERGVPADAVRQLGVYLRVLSERPHCILGLVERDADAHLGAESVRLELELGDGAEVSAAPMERPEEIRVIVLADSDGFARGGDKLERAEVVARQGVLAREPADAAAKREPADAGLRNDPGRNDKAVGGGGGIDVAEEAAALHLDDLLV
jgi:hypothetical protein